MCHFVYSNSHVLLVQMCVLFLSLWDVCFQPVTVTFLCEISANQMEGKPKATLPTTSGKFNLAAVAFCSGLVVCVNIIEFPVDDGSSHAAARCVCLNRIVFLCLEYWRLVHTLK